MRWKLFLLVFFSFYLVTPLLWAGGYKLGTETYYYLNDNRYDVDEVDAIPSSGYLGDDCSTNHAIKSWFLMEVNVNDFRQSYMFCRPVLTSGSQGDPAVRIDQFNKPKLSGDTLGLAKIPDSYLAIGIKLQFTSTDIAGIETHKVQDMALLYFPAQKIAANSPLTVYNVPQYQDTDYAMGRGAYSSDIDMVCPLGTVLTGIYVKPKWAWDLAGNARAEIRAVGMSCRELLYQ